MVMVSQRHSAPESGSKTVGGRKSRALFVGVLTIAATVVGIVTGAPEGKALTYSRTQASSTTVDLLCGSTGTSGNSIFTAGVTITEDTGGRSFVLAGDSLKISAPARTGSCALSGLSAPLFEANQAMPDGEGTLWSMKDSTGAVINMTTGVDWFPSLPITIKFLKADARTLSWDFAFVTTVANSVQQRVNSSVNIWNGILDEQPQAPTNLSNAQYNSATQKVEVSVDTPSIPVAGYQYRIYSSGTTPTAQANPFLPSHSSTWQGIDNFDGVALPQLSNGTVPVPSGPLSAGSYVLELRAVRNVQPNSNSSRAIWDKGASVKTTFTVSTVPNSPANVVATAGDATVNVTWAAPANTGGSPITGYRVAARDNFMNIVRYSQAAAECAVSASTFTCTYTGLTNGTQYTFRVYADNVNGPSVDALATATPVASSSGGGGSAGPTSPSAPTNVAATAGDTTVTLTWDPPATDGGSPIAVYIVRATTSTGAAVPYGSNQYCVVNAPTTTCVYSGLTNGVLHSFDVIARNVSNVQGPIASVTATPTAGGSGAGSSGGSSSGDGAGTGTSLSDSGTSNSSTSTPSGPTATTSTTVGEAPVVAESTSVPTLVTNKDITKLAQRAGNAGAIIDGREVEANVQRVVVDGIDVAPNDRTPEQVDAVRNAAQVLVRSFNKIAGPTSGITVKNSPTGAVVLGLTSASGAAVSKPVPVERVVLVTVGGVAMLMAGTDSAGNALALTDNGSVVLRPKGLLSIALSGLTANSSGEVVLATSRKVLSTFSTSASGSTRVVVARPADLAGTGSHTLVLAAGETRIGIGIAATGSVAELPRTGGDAPVAVPLSFIGLGLVLVWANRRRRAIV